MPGDIFSMFREEETTAPEGEDGALETVSFHETEKTVVVSVGGSLLAGEKPAAPYIAKLAETIHTLSRKGYKFVLVAGGGATARAYIAAAKALGAGAFEQDVVGIAATRLNALLLVQGVENAHPKVLTRIEDARLVLASGRIPVYGGLFAGITTDAVAALLAEALDAVLVNLTNVRGVYSKDPKTHPHARFYPSISYERLLSLMRQAEDKPGQHKILDTSACLVLKRSAVPAYILDGRDPGNLARALEGEGFDGTRVQENPGKER